MSASAPLTAAMIDVLDERRRQVAGEGFDAAHDDAHRDGSLALAAICYAAPVRLYREDRSLAAGPLFADPWPEDWDDQWDKRLRYGERRQNPGNSVPDPATYSARERRELLVKAAALLIAEIERLDRAAFLARARAL